MTYILNADENNWYLLQKFYKNQNYSYNTIIAALFADIRVEGQIVNEICYNLSCDSLEMYSQPFHIEKDCKLFSVYQPISNINPTEDWNLFQFIMKSNALQILSKVSEQLQLFNSKYRENKILDTKLKLPEITYYLNIWRDYDYNLQYLPRSCLESDTLSVMSYLNVDDMVSIPIDISNSGEINIL